MAVNNFGMDLNAKTLGELMVAMGLRETADGGVDGKTVVVENNKKGVLVKADVVKGLEGEAANKAGVADEGGD